MKFQTAFWRKLLPLILPMALQNIMQSLVSASDVLMLGLVDQSSLSAVSLASQMQFVYSLFIFGLTAGASILAAQYWGKEDIPSVEQILAILFRTLVGIGAVFTAFALFSPELLMRIFTPDRELIAIGSRYLRMVGLSYLLSGITSTYTCIMRNCGQAPAAAGISSVFVVLNILLNAVLIFGLLGAPEMGVLGAALATSLTRAMEAVTILCYTRRRSPIHLRGKLLRMLKIPMTGEFWTQAWIVLANNLIWGVGITVGSVILGHLGSDAVAANSIAVVIKNLVASFCFGLAGGGAVLVGNELGAGRLDTGKVYGEKIVSLSLVIGVVSGAVLIALTPLILKVAELSPQAQEYIRWMIVVCAVNLVGMSHNSATISGIFPAGGDTRFGFICDIITLWCVVVPISLMAAFVWKLPVLVVYIFINMDELVKFPAVRINLRKYNWVRDLTREHE